ncbi:MAG: hypothetical protein HC844_18925 [Tabrizicola sp.]|nr:hypothetical protein [Tabrizicola sp.]
MRRWLSLSSYHWFVLFCVMGICAMFLAWISFGLINLAMANFDFIRRHGLMALAEGGLLQSLEIGAKAFLALVLYFGFKSIETELIHRWRGKGDH